MRRLLTAVAIVALAGSAGQAAGPYHAPRNLYGQPDLEGFWTNATLTPTTRDAKLGARAVFSADEVAQLEGAQKAGIEKGNARVDNSKPLTAGVIQARGGASIVGNYDRAWFDPGNAVMRVGGQPRSSILTTPDGQVPMTKTGQRVRAFANAEGGAATGVRGGAFDNPESRGLGERCIISFGRNGGPPMLANGFYNNNYQFVQGRDSVAINIEMVHDTRIVRLNSKHRTDNIRPWFGDSIGWYEGDTLVVETNHIPKAQAYFGAWETLTVTERFTRVGGARLRYQFTVADPATWDRPWGGEYEFHALK